jgi:ABC-type multidrug transport system fused ATPase/permease subunit
VILSDVARFITETLRTFGVLNDTVDIGFPLESSGGDSAASKEQVLTPFLDVLTKFREAVRLAAMSGDTKAVLEAADGLRDNVLPDLGVRMEDKGSGKVSAVSVPVVVSVTNVITTTTTTTIIIIIIIIIIMTIIIIIMTIIIIIIIIFFFIIMTIMTTYIDWNSCCRM